MKALKIICEKNMKLSAPSVAAAAAVALTGPFTHTRRSNAVFHELENMHLAGFRSEEKKPSESSLEMKAIKNIYIINTLCFFGFGFRRDRCLSGPAGGAIDQDVSHCWPEDAFQVEY